MQTSLCKDWEFIPECTDRFITGKDVNDPAPECVSIPHTVRELPLQYADSSSYQMICGYRKLLHIDKKPGMRYFVYFEGAAHVAEVFADGIHLLEHKCGYTAFRAEITDYIKPDGSCLLAVRLNTREDQNVPPFGYVIDYLTYGGIYRPVWLEERPECYIEDVFVFTPDLSRANINITMSSYEAFTDSREPVSYTISSMDGTEIMSGTNIMLSFSVTSTKFLPWSVNEPNLYNLKVSYGEDSYTTTFGFRTAVFHSDGFYLNGMKLYLRGLNRHQSFPYIGYAACDSLQRFDARVLKNELGCNIVRTSHYPQSKSFIDECDRLGLLVFTEIPGWQHIGDESWQEQAVKNTEEMVMQYRNHPSIILWGVRINESVDNDALYEKTNETAHRLDPSRATSGVRYLEKSHLLEDVYAYNDFSHTGNNPGAKQRSKVVSEKVKPLLISESNGHMFPTKPFDTWKRREEHALRHARVLNDSIALSDHVGCIQWCMFDYPTHKDFGSGDRICYHGVMDQFRNPKTAAALYASQSDISPVLEIGSSMDIGDYNAGMLESTYVFTNADEIKLYKNDIYVTSFKDSDFTSLPHGPLCIDDTIGCLLMTNEGFTGRKEKLLHSGLVSVAKYGMANLPLHEYFKLGWVMLRYRMNMDDCVKLYGKYVGNWGGEAVKWRFDAIKEGEVIASRTLSSSTRLHIEAHASNEVLDTGITYDESLVRVQLLDEYNNPVPYLNVPVTFETSGDITICGPNTASSAGGATGTIIRTVPNAHKGAASLRISANGMEPVVLNFTIK